MKTNGSSSYGEVNSSDTALGQVELAGVRPSQPDFHSNITDHNRNN